MAYLVCVATEKELTALAPDVFADSAGYDEMRLIEMPASYMAKEQLFFCITGVGPINAAMAVGKCLEVASRKCKVEAVFNIGLAGAYDLSMVPLRTLCWVKEEIWPEYGLHDGFSVTARAFSFPLWQRQEGDVYDSITLSSPGEIDSRFSKIADEKYLACRSLTVAGVSASFGRAGQLLNTYHADLENMEGFAVAYACARFAMPCLEIRSVSNKVGPRKKDEKDFPGALEVLSTVLPSLNLL